MSKIAFVSKLVQILIVATATLHIAAYLSVIFFGEFQGTGRHFSAHFGFMSPDFSIDFIKSWQHMALALEAETFNSAAILGLAKLIPYILNYYFIFRLFGLYKTGVIFTYANTRCLKYIGATLIGWIFLNLFYPLLVVLVIRFTDASQTINSVNFILGLQDLTYLLMGLVIYVIAWIMNEAIELKQQQELVI